MNEKNIVKMVEAIRAGGGNSDSSLMLAQVSSVSPLTIKTSNSVITKNIYINPAYIIQTPDALFVSPPDPDLSYLFNFLRQYHKSYMLNTGDTVILVQFGVSFYIAEKVVKAV